MVSSLAAILLGVFLAQPPSPPEQPLGGPGGRAYAHEGVTASKLGSGAEEVYLFEPAEPTPQRAPVVVFGHGWGGMSPNYYGAWIAHIVRRGSIVIFPRYQADLRTPVRDFTPNAMAAVRRALEELRAPGHVTPDERGLAFVGHSMGGLIVANLASRAAKGELPPPLALMGVEPGKTWPEGTPIAFPLEDLSGLPSSVLLVAVVGDDDDFVLDIDARKITTERRGCRSPTRTTYGCSPTTTGSPRSSPTTSADGSRRPRRGGRLGNRDRPEHRRSRLLCRVEALRRARRRRLSRGQPGIRPRRHAGAAVHGAMERWDSRPGPAG